MLARSAPLKTADSRRICTESTAATNPAGSYPRPPGVRDEALRIGRLSYRTSPRPALCGRTPRRTEKKPVELPSLRDALHRMYQQIYIRGYSLILNRFVLPCLH